MKPIIPLDTEPRVPNDQKLVTVADLETYGEKMLATIRMMIQANGCLTSKKWLKSHQMRKLMNIFAWTLQTLRSNGQYLILGLEALFIMIPQKLKNDETKLETCMVMDKL